MDQIGKMLIFAGLGLALVGGLLWASQSVPWLRLGRLPGDLSYQKDGMSVFFPITTMILLSLVLSGVFWLVQLFRK